MFSMNYSLKKQVIPTPIQQFDTPSYLIKPIFPPARKPVKKIAMTDRPQPKKKRSLPVEIKQKPKPTQKESKETTIHIFKPKTTTVREPERRKRRPRLLEEQTPIETG